MTNERIKQIEEKVGWQEDVAKGILAGDRDNYDGADGARCVRDLCAIIRELLKEVEKLQMRDNASEAINFGKGL